MISLFLASIFLLTGCPGRDGEDGQAYVAISYSQTQPVSYWDNNDSIPYGLRYGNYYYSQPGIYDFEYFVSADQSWAGTYEVYKNYGERGHDFMSDGEDGADTCLMIFCDPDGPRFERFEGYPYDYYGSVDGEPVDIERDFGRFSIRIKAKKQFGQPPSSSPKISSNSR